MFLYWRLKLLFIHTLIFMAPISNAEKCRRYREKHQDEYKKRDVLRKRHTIATIKVKDSVTNEIRLKIQRDKKREYRKRINELKTKENNPPSDSPNSSFSNKAVKSRSLKKVVDALPKSPNKRTEIVQSLSKKFNLRIKFMNKKPGRRGRNRLVIWIYESILEKKIKGTLTRKMVKACLSLSGTCYGQYEIYWTLLMDVLLWSRLKLTTFQPFSTRH